LGRSAIILPHPGISPRRVDLLIFDLDGTLANTLQDLANAVYYALEKLGKSPLKPASVQSYIGDGVKKLLERVLENPPPGVLESAMWFFREYYAAHLADFTTLYPGVQDILEFFSHKKKIILTNKPDEFALPLVKRLGIADYFAEIIGGSAGYALKPHPQGILDIIQRHQSQPEKVIIIGDGENDILAGKNAGILTCAVTFGFRPPELLQSLNPDFVIDDLLELKKLII
jgi:phosphoglycolate phosphatase